ncbi:DnaJ-like chaperonin [Microbacterium phage RubyRalph]|nr:DnaJ-like chaperonin [Microbacterium phage RubyRalph]
MTDWPADLKIGPIGDWPGAMTPRRRVSPFRANLSSTLTLLRRELRELGAENIEMLIAIPPGAFRLDGRPYANAKPEHPGIILSFDVKAGHLSYPSDAFTTWQDNLRAVALSLDALRKVDRYGVTKHGEQYRGFLAIEAVPSGEWASTALAREFIETYISGLGVTTKLGDIAFQLKQAKRLSHPDLPSGDPETFRKVMSAEKRLREAGEIR